MSSTAFPSTREESTAWQGELARLFAALAGDRALSPAGFDAPARLAGATNMIGRQQAPVAQPGKGR